ncbi:hypothetical protein EYF80_016731 [Liparis tanakae]|uniref:Uncharacterized protein n=1 Tax=Liparis tanakae TaxID=230148 RepID=A0A4Z2I5L1_9TELE|nr:hypothetical protein EYF80_016731 [Liparis tanakae]
MVGDVYVPQGHALGGPDTTASGPEPRALMSTFLSMSRHFFNQKRQETKQVKAPCLQLKVNCPKATRVVGSTPKRKHWMTYIVTRNPKETPSYDWSRGFCRGDTCHGWRVATPTLWSLVNVLDDAPEAAAHVSLCLSSHCQLLHPGVDLAKQIRLKSHDLQRCREVVFFVASAQQQLFPVFVLSNSL